MTQVLMIELMHAFKFLSRLCLMADFRRAFEIYTCGHRHRKTEAGSEKLGNGMRKLENGAWKLENGSWKAQNGHRKAECRVPVASIR